MVSAARQPLPRAEGYLQRGSLFLFSSRWGESLQPRDVLPRLREDEVWDWCVSAVDWAS